VQQLPRLPRLSQLLASRINVLRNCRWPSGGSDMAGRIGSIQKAQDGQSYGFAS
jgi:hypothetical protein